MTITKGKWLKHGLVIETAYAPDGEVIAVINEVGDKEKARANAHLIAAAPKLHKALEAALPALQGIFDKNDNRPKHIKDKINLIVAALAEAEGK